MAKAVPRKRKAPPKGKLVRLTEDEVDLLISLRRLNQKTYRLDEVLIEEAHDRGRKSSFGKDATPFYSCMKGLAEIHGDLTKPIGPE